MRVDILFFIVATAFIGLYIGFFDQLEDLKKQYAVYLGILSAIAFPILFLFRGIKAKKDPDNKTNKLSKREREEFSKVDFLEDPNKKKW